MDEKKRRYIEKGLNMIIQNTFTDARYYLYWDGIKQQYHVCNLDTGSVMIWSSVDLQNAFEFGHYEKVDL